ncbi:glycosyltransferase family 4 protein [Clostridium disporicum]|uniref:Glycosyltransferase n=1 Tax=Clostridium disporicum TaxID=84024 RepID=A0A174F1V3_9CLOT|nr:glycosyltransferase family 4 protein [Clostridium disporicum]CUO42908.1 glycosyltransferase [Clostridium disporicum]
MNIMFINHENSLGGASKSLLGIIDEFSKKEDINIKVVIPSDGRNELENELINRNIEYFKLKYYWWMVPNREEYRTTIYTIKKCLYYIWNYIQAIKLAKICKKSNIDIIHTNSSVINIGGLISRLTGVKHVWHIREFGEEDHNLRFLYDRDKSLKFICRNSAKVIAISESIYNKYESIFTNGKMEVIYNGVNVKNVIEKREKKKEESINILLAGALKESKGQECAILAIKELVKDNYNVTLSLAGKDENNYENKLKELVSKLHLEKNVKFLGFLNSLDKIREDMDLELVCSKKEAFGRVTVEAMMNMNPVIGADTGATVELIKEGYNGLLYRENDEIDLANKIKVLIDDPILRKKIGERGKKFAEENFTSEINACRIYNLYREIINI